MKKSFKLANHLIGKNYPAFVIAEIAQAHDGSLGTAHAYIDALQKENGIFQPEERNRPHFPIQCRSTYTTTWCGGRINGWSQNWSDILVVLGRKMTDAIHFLAKKKSSPFI